MRVRWLWLLLLPLILVLMMPAAALDGWLYYRDITISNSLDQELTDYQVKIVLDTYSLILGGKMRSDCGDIRFTDAGGNLLPYWIEPGTCNSQNTVIWVKVPYIPANGQTTIKLVYGNPSAGSLSDVSSVFIREIDGVAGSWLLDEGSGTTVCDTSGNNNHGTIYGGVEWIDGIRGKALNFDGVNDYVDIPHSSSLNLNELTVVAWFKSTYSGAWFTTIVIKYGYTTGTTPPSWGLGWIDTNLLGFYIRDASKVRNTASATTGEGLDGNWHFLAGVASSTEVQFWMDGVLKSSVSRTAGDFRNTNPVSFARHQGIYVPEAIDDVLIFNRALNSEEIITLYSNRAYTTPNYPGKALIRAYASQEPSIAVGNEVVLLPDITVTNISTPALIAVQQPFNVDVKVKNIGNKPAGSLKVGIYVDSSKVAEQTVNSLDTDEEVQLSFSITVNQPGNHIIKAMVDIYNEVEESVETNNEMSVLRYVAAPDLTVTSIDVQSSAVVGETVNITATVENVGDATASNVKISLVVTLYGEVKYSSERRVTLAPQQSTELAFSFRPSQAGTHVIRVVADSEDEFVELNEFNNTATASVSVSTSQAPPVPSPDGGVFPYPTPPVGGKTFREIYEPLTLRTYNLPLEAMSLIAVLGISVVGYGFGVFRGTVNFFFLSVVYFIVSTFLGWSMFIAAGLLAVATMLLVVTVAFIRED